MDNDCPRYRPFGPSTTTQRIVKVKKAKYSTSLDPRGYIPGNTIKHSWQSSQLTYTYAVYEYLINGQPIMWDRESGSLITLFSWARLN